MKKLTQNISSVQLGKVQFYPSGSNYQPTSSAPATAAQFDIHIPSTVGGDWISNSELNPYIVIPLISSSYTGTGFDEELIIRFFTSSHFRDYRTGSFPPDGGGWNVNSVSASIYYTSSNTYAKYRDVLLTPTAKGVGTATSLRNIIFDLITGSSAYNSGMISASKQGNFTSSIHLINARGKVNPPTVYTGSLASNAGFSINIISTGSGTLNFSENYFLSENSASLSIGFDPLDSKSMLFSVSTSSLSYVGTGRFSPNLLYFSSSGKIGINTADPQVGLDIIADEVQFQQPGSRKGLKINDDGSIESFNKDINSATTGSEFILRYSRGTTINAESMNALFGEGSFRDDGEAVDYFNSLKSEEQSSILEKLESLGFNTLPNVGDTIGSIRFIAESGSVAGFSDRTTGEAASIRALVSDIDETGVKGDLIFSVAGKEGASEQKLLLDANNNHELTGSLDITSNLMIGAGIFHKGDTDTSLNFTDDTITFKVGNETLMQIVEHTQDQVLIGDGGDVDFRVVTNGQSISDTNPSLFVEGSSGEVGIGTDTPGEKLEVIGNISASGTITAFSSNIVTINGGSF
jgi:hypothetical protein